MSDVRGAIETLERFLAEAKDWEGQREAWTLVCNRESAAKDRAELFRVAPREDAMRIIFDGDRIRPEWSGNTAGNDDVALALRSQILRRYSK